MIYLDYAAATPIDQRVAEAMLPYQQERFFNPSALYTSAREVRREVDSFRSKVASILGAKPGEVHFTAGATESINLAFAGLLRRFPDASIAVSALEHSSVVAAAKGFASKVIKIPVDQDGLVDSERVAQLVEDDTVLISVGYVNGEIGTVQPMDKIVQAVNEVRVSRKQKGSDLPLYLHSDASQAPEYFDINLSRLKLDLMTLNGGKIYGPKQSGILYVRHGIKLEPLIYGGGQEGGLRAGTENVAAIAGFTRALELSQDTHKQESGRQRRLQQQLIEELASLGAELNGAKKRRSPGNVSVSFKGVNGETLVHYLDAEGIMVATGAACQASSAQPSPALLAIGLDEQAVDGSLRISLGRDTDENSVSTFVEAMSRLLPRLRA